MKKLLIALFGISSFAMAMPYECELKIGTSLHLNYDENGLGRGMERICDVEGVLIWVFKVNKNGSMVKLPSDVYDSGNALCEDATTAIAAGQKRLQGLKDQGVCQ